MAEGLSLESLADVRSDENGRHHCERHPHSKQLEAFSWPEKVHRGAVAVRKGYL